MDRACEFCGGGLMLARAGARFCSTNCRVKAYQRRKKAASVVPAGMRREDRWLRWAKVNRRGKISKRPVAVDGTPGSSTDERTWTDYKTAEASAVGHGFGFALGNGIGCIDLDGCLQDGELAGWAREILDAAPETFIEVSQSGNGLHIFGLLPESPGRNTGNGVEVYSVGRFIAMTGNRYDSAPSSLADISELVADII